MNKTAEMHVLIFFELLVTRSSRSALNVSDKDGAT